jgi:alcohol dehydrogenase class IV
VTTASRSASFVYQPPNFPEVHGGENALSSLAGILDSRSIDRALVVTSPTFVRNSRVLDRIAGLLGPRLAGVFGEVRPHSPMEQVEAALASFRACNARGLISLGGGSAVDTTKGVVWYADDSGSSPPIVHVAIPSTFSGAEYTTDAGITVNGGKKVHRDRRIIPAAVVLDPEVAGSTPIELRRSSLANALAHCLEGSVSVQASPMTDAFYLHAIHLVKAASDRLDSADGLVAGQAAAALAALHQVSMGLAHAFAHVIGGRYRTPHGATHGVLAPAVMRLNLPAVAARQAGIGRALGIPMTSGEIESAWLAVQGVRSLVGRLGAPPGLRDLGVPRDELRTIVELATHDSGYPANPRPLDGAAGSRLALECLEWAWSGEIPPP